MPDWGMIQVAVGVGLLWLMMPEHWWRLMRTSVRWLWTRVRSQEGLCDYIEWEQLLANPHWRLHQCDGPWLPHPQHEEGAECWKTSFQAFCNRVSPHRTIMKPVRLAVRERYLCIDREVLLAFILCAIEECFRPAPLLHLIGPHPKRFREFGVEIDIESELREAADVLVIHLAYRPIETDRVRNNHHLTIGDLKRLINFYPPYYREYLKYFGHTLPKSIMIPNDEAVRRGGWVIAVGLMDLKPVPVYMDVAGDAIDRRGAVFWQSINRVKEVIENNFLRLSGLQEEEMRDIQATIRGLAYLVTEKTDSGASGATSGSRSGSIRRGILSVEQCTQAINIFNDKDSRLLDDEGLLRLEEQLKPMLLHVLQAAYAGASECVAYVKNPGRELNRILPRSLVEAERVFLKSCA